MMSGKTTTEQYQILVQLTPPWFEALLAFRVAADWSRTKMSVQTPEPGEPRRIVGSCTVRMNRQRKPDLAPVPPVAGEGQFGPLSLALASLRR